MCPEDMKGYFLYKLMVFSMRKANLDTVKENKKNRKFTRAGVKLRNIWEKAGYSIPLGAYTKFSLANDQDGIK